MQAQHIVAVTDLVSYESQQQLPQPWFQQNPPALPVDVRRSLKERMQRLSEDAEACSDDTFMTFFVRAGHTTGGAQGMRLLRMGWLLELIQTKVGGGVEGEGEDGVAAGAHPDQGGGGWGGRERMGWLLELIQTKDIFRRYPNQYDSIVATLCDNLDSLDEPEAKSSMVWIIGEYAERIDNADELPEAFLETFPEETSMMGSSCSCSRPRPTTRSPRPRLHLLAPAVHHREAAKDVVLAEKHLVIADDSLSLDPSLLEALVSRYLATVAAVYHRPPETFVSRQRLAVTRADELGARKFEEEDGSVPGAMVSDNNAAAVAGAAAAAAASSVRDLLDMSDPTPMPAAPAAAAVAPAAPRGLDDLLGALGSLDMGGGADRVPTGAPKRHDGSGGWSHDPDKPQQLRPGADKPGPGHSHARRRRPAGLRGSGPGAAPHRRGSRPGMVTPPPLSTGLQVAQRTTQVGVLYFNDAVPLSALTEEAGSMEAADFLAAWKALPPEASARLPLAVPSADVAKERLGAANLFVLAHCQVAQTAVQQLLI
ncbi:hypothetical protein HYH03_011092 [Edaphochlamys debaryana]|uniref:Uncharacterized protein n=2 Tax=Edaphochlamys debaryana TaxID=47281 RepID=A0A835XSM0_9CHLO|nr:hypothetical protein HYH03_011092 [Edaphochlamys debaryana]|eukprot:KAG2490457.1 hypothetical protein HYH03_011092 [Edaphochlamys debaryana]